MAAPTLTYQQRLQQAYRSGQLVAHQQRQPPGFPKLSLQQRYQQGQFAPQPSFPTRPTATPEQQRAEYERTKITPEQYAQAAQNLGYQPGLGLGLGIVSAPGGEFGLPQAVRWLTDSMYDFMGVELPPDAPRKPWWEEIAERPGGYLAETGKIWIARAPRFIPGMLSGLFQAIGDRFPSLEMPAFKIEKEAARIAGKPVPKMNKREATRELLWWGALGLGSVLAGPLFSAASIKIAGHLLTEGALYTMLAGIGEEMWSTKGQSLFEQPFEATVGGLIARGRYKQLKRSPTFVKANVKQLEKIEAFKKGLEKEGLAPEEIERRTTQFNEETSAGLPVVTLRDWYEKGSTQKILREAQVEARQQKIETLNKAREAAELKASGPKHGSIRSVYKYIFPKYIEPLVKEGLVDEAAANRGAIFMGYLVKKSAQAGGKWSEKAIGVSEGVRELPINKIMDEIGRENMLAIIGKKRRLGAEGVRQKNKLRDAMTELTADMKAGRIPFEKAQAEVEKLEKRHDALVMKGGGEYLSEMEPKWETVGRGLKDMEFRPAKPEAPPKVEAAVAVGEKAVKVKGGIKDFISEARRPLQDKENFLRTFKARMEGLSEKQRAKLEKDMQAQFGEPLTGENIWKQARPEEEFLIPRTEPPPIEAVQPPPEVAKPPEAEVKAGPLPKTMLEKAQETGKFEEFVRHQEGYSIPGLKKLLKDQEELDAWYKENPGYTSQTAGVMSREENQFFLEVFKEALKRTEAKAEPVTPPAEPVHEATKPLRDTLDQLNTEGGKPPSEWEGLEIATAKERVARDLKQEWSHLVAGRAAKRIKDPITLRLMKQAEVEDGVMSFVSLLREIKSGLLGEEMTPGAEVARGIMGAVFDGARDDAVGLFSKEGRAQWIEQSTPLRWLDGVKQWVGKLNALEKQLNRSVRRELIGQDKFLLQAWLDEVKRVSKQLDKRLPEIEQVIKDWEVRGGGGGPETIIEGRTLLPQGRLNKAIADILGGLWRRIIRLFKPITEAPLMKAIIQRVKDHPFAKTMPPEVREMQKFIVGETAGILHWLKQNIKDIKYLPQKLREEMGDWMGIRDDLVDRIIMVEGKEVEIPAGHFTHEIAKVIDAYVTRGEITAKQAENAKAFWRTFVKAENERNAVFKEKFAEMEKKYTARLNGEGYTEAEIAQALAEVRYKTRTIEWASHTYRRFLTPEERAEQRSIIDKGRERIEDLAAKEVTQTSQKAFIKSLTEVLDARQKLHNFETSGGLDYVPLLHAGSLKGADFYRYLGGRESIAGHSLKQRVQDVPEDVLNEHKIRDAYLLTKTLLEQSGVDEARSLFYLMTKVTMGKDFVLSPDDIQRGAVVPKGWKEVPEKASRGASYGALRKHFVHPALMKEVDFLWMFSESMRESLRLWHGVLGNWRFMKAVLNIPNFVRNPLTNYFFFLPMQGMFWADQVKYHNVVTKKLEGPDGRLYMEKLVKARIIGSGGEAFILEQMARGEAGWKGVGQAMQRFLEGDRSAALDFYRNFRETVTRSKYGYGWWDDVAKASFYEWLRDKRGLTHKQAVKLVHERLPNYELWNKPEGVRVLRNTISPFFLFTYESTRVFLNTLKDRPLGVITIATLPFIMQKIANEWSGLTSEETDAIRDSIRQRTGRDPGAVILGYDKATKNSTWVPMNYALPLILNVPPSGNFRDMLRDVGGQFGGAERKMLVSNPILDLVQAFKTGNNQFGYPILEPQHTKMLSKGLDVAEYLLQMGGPAVYYDLMMAKAALWGDEQFMGQPLEAVRAWTRLTSIPSYVEHLPRTRKSVRSQRRGQEILLKARRRQALRDGLPETAKEFTEALKEMYKEDRDIKRQLAKMPS